MTVVMGKSVPRPSNEVVRNYVPGDLDCVSLKKRLDTMSSEKIEIPCWIGGKEVWTGVKGQVAMPHSHRHVLADYHIAGPKEMTLAMDASKNAKQQWQSWRWEDRVAVFLKAADLLSNKYRNTLNASTMLGQSKNVYQAEIDSACELIDFFRFNAYFYQEIIRNQPDSSLGVWNQMDYRPLEGFVFAITPFNFTAIAGNLPSAPAMLGNTVVWKPARTQVLSAHYIMRLLHDAGLPGGVINMIPCQGQMASEIVLTSQDLAGVHFTGSTNTFQSIWKTVGGNISSYFNYPRLVGETGGKDFVFVHPSAEIDSVVTALVRGAFEYQGQKCSAASRAYIPHSLWNKIQEKLLVDIASLKMGDVRDFKNFVNAVIDRPAFEKIQSYLEKAKRSSDAKVIVGGKANADEGYFIEPTVILTAQPNYPSMVEEIFGPVLTIHVYQDDALENTLDICEKTSPYALTGAIFAQDREAIVELRNKLRFAAGNFYINDKPTGAVVGQQPFGGARASGTNDKAGSYLNLLRWLSPRTIKENLAPPEHYEYPFHS